MEVKIVKNYIKKDILKNLNNWTLENYKKKFFNISNMNNCQTRYTTRQCINRNVGHLFDYPNFIYDIQEKIRNDFNIFDQSVASIGKNGIVSGIGFENDYIKEHTDPIWIENTQTIHFNIISQKPLNGGITIIDNKKYDIDSEDLLIYNVSKYKHFVTRVYGNIPRILYVFGFCLTNDKIKKIFN